MSPSLLVLIVACHGGNQDTSSDGHWVVDEVDLGQAMASGQGYVYENPNAGWFAAEQIAPHLDTRWSFPPVDIPMYLWDIAQGPNIADEGSCPYTWADTDAGVQGWRSDCWSEDGYMWTGEVTKTRPTEDDASMDWVRWDFDLEIIPRDTVERPTFTALELKGSLFHATGNTDAFARAAQVNISARVDGYWESHSVLDDDLEAAWNPWVLTGRYEEYSDESNQFEGVADLGELGGLSFSSDDLTQEANCPSEPAGRLSLDNEHQATLRFEGVDKCDRCAEMTLDGEFFGQACASDYR